MIKLRVRPIKLRRWFPPNDPVATGVATLCVLREDFYLELQGIISDDVAPLDGNTEAYRRTYFWRNSLRTLEEIKNTLNELNRVEDFRAAMREEPPDVQAAFRDATRALNRASEKFLRELRNKVGGHIDLDRMQAGLDALEIGHESAVQLGRTRDLTHYRFAVELLWSAILRDSPTTSSNEAVEKLLGDTAVLMFNPRRGG